jgi:hypothetical protein
MALKTMPIAKLQALKSQVEAAITEKVRSRRQELETELSKLGGRSLVVSVAAENAEGLRDAAE